MKVFGIDISKWQKGYPYDKANAEGVKFAILRAGYDVSKDSQFETHYQNAKRLGWGVGAYWYTYAKSTAQAKKEAQAFLNAIKGKQFDYPVYLDIEDKSIRNLGKSKIDDIVITFCETLEAAGYYVGVYTNQDWYRNVLSGTTLNKKYDWWIAKWSTSEPTGVNYGIWQFGGETNYIRGNKVAGVTTDQNYAVKDYPTIIKNAGLNGYGKQTTPSKPNNESQSKPAPTGGKFKIGDKVVVNGPLYVNANASNATGRVSNRSTTITRYSAGSKHPYNTTGDLGWMDESSIKLQGATTSSSLKVGDSVKIVGKGNANANGTGATASGIGWTRQILSIKSGKKFPYQVGNSSGTTGYYPASSLQKK